jgi:hypothetical protein
MLERRRRDAEWLRVNHDLLRLEEREVTLSCAAPRRRSPPLVPARTCFGADRCRSIAGNPYPAARIPVMAQRGLDTVALATQADIRMLAKSGNAVDAAQAAAARGHFCALRRQRPDLSSQRSPVRSVPTRTSKRERVKWPQRTVVPDDLVVGDRDRRVATAWSRIDTKRSDTIRVCGVAQSRPQRVLFHVDRGTVPLVVSITSVAVAAGIGVSVALACCLRIGCERS